MTSETNTTNAHSNTRKIQFFKLGFAALCTLLVMFGLLDGNSNTTSSSGRVDAFNEADSVKADSVFALVQAVTPTPEFLGMSDAAPPQDSDSHAFRKRLRKGSLARRCRCLSAQAERR